MIVVPEDVITGNSSTSAEVIVMVKDCSAVVNGVTIGRSSNYKVFRSISKLEISYVEGDYLATCTWGNRDNAYIISGSKYNSYAGIVSSQSPYEGVGTLVLGIKGSTCVCIIPNNSPVKPIYYTITDSVRSYKLGFSDSNYREISQNSLSEGLYSVEFENESSNSLHVFGVVPISSSNTVAVMQYNGNKNSFVADTDDTPIPVNSNYAKGQTVTAWAGWYGRWINVKCTGASSGSSSSSDQDTIRFSSTYKPRLTAPSNDNLYYKRRAYGGYNPCIGGNTAHGARPYEGSVIPNCVGYAVGRFNEIGGYGECRYLGNTNAENFVSLYGDDLGVSQVPSQGAVAVWRVGNIFNGNDGCGHVAIVEEIYSDGSILTSESGWSARNAFWTTKRSKGNGNWGQGAAYTFLGFIKNPAVTYNTSSAESIWGAATLSGAAAAAAAAASASAISEMIEAAIAAAQIGAQTAGAANSSQASGNFSYEKELLGNVADVHGMQLLTLPALVESPFIEVKIGKYTFGSYTKEGTLERNLSTARVTYPNYMESLRITKINGAVNQYILTMNYQIQAGDDPNLIDKVFSSVSNDRKITLTYGDWNSPSFIYRNEEAIITKVTSNVDFQQARIRYTVYCTSSSVALKSKTYQFGAHFNTKPSKVIRDLLSNNTYGLLDIFYGMKNLDKVAALGLIPSDDKAVDIKPKLDVDIITYLNYLVSCMSSNSTQDDFIKDAAYHLIMKDEISGDLEGPYFQIVKINTTSKSITSLNAYEINVGFPDNAQVLNFQITNDNSWAILYNYAQSIDQEQYVYKIDDLGNMRVERSPNVMTSNVYYQTTEANKNWWTQMTQFPINATLTIKGLIRPAMLMEYVKVNAVFYGQRHVSSGLYVITKQEDEVSKSGYRTTLSLTRIAGDEDALYNIKQTEVTPLQQAASTASDLLDLGVSTAVSGATSAAQDNFVSGSVTGAAAGVSQIFNSETSTSPDGSVESNFSGGKIGGGSSGGYIGSGSRGH